MTSNNDKNKLGEIKDGLKSIGANLDNISFVYKTSGNLFRLSDGLEDKNLRSRIKEELARIMQTQYKEEIQQILKTIFSIISETEKEEIKEKKFFQDAILDRTDEYLEDCKKYSAYKNNIKELEKKITSAEVYQKKLHKKWDMGRNGKTIIMLD